MSDITDIDDDRGGCDSSAAASGLPNHRRGPGGGSASAAAAPSTGGGQPQRPVPAAQATAEQKQLQYLHHNCNPRHNNSVNAMSIETDVWQGNGEIFDFAAS